MDALGNLIVFTVCAGLVLAWLGGFYAGRVFERHWPKGRT